MKRGGQAAPQEPESAMLAVAAGEADEAWLSEWLRGRVRFG